MQITPKIMPNVVIRPKFLKPVTVLNQMTFFSNTVFGNLSCLKSTRFEFITHTQKKMSTIFSEYF